MKKFINDVALVEEQMIQGMVKAYPGYLRKLDCGNVVVRANKKEGKVALINFPIYPYRILQISHSQHHHPLTPR